MRRELASILLCATLAIPGAALAAHPTWPHDSTTNVPVCQADGEQTTPIAISDGAGGVFLVWTDGRRYLSHDIYAQRLGRDGRPLWTSSGVAVRVSDHDAIEPRVIPDGAGGILVSWRDLNDASQWNVRAQRLGSLGIAQWQSGGMPVCAVASNQTSPALASDGAGGAIVVWNDDRNYGSRLYAQRIGPNGSTLWNSNGLPVCETVGSQILPAAVPDGAGGAIVAWQDGRDMLHSDIYAQRLGPTGAKRWAAQGARACVTPGYAYAVFLAPDGHGGAIATWEDFRIATDTDILAQRFDSLGAPLWGADGAAVCEVPQSQADPTLAVDAAGGAIVAWHDYRVYGILQVRAQRIGATGTPLWTSGGELLCAQGNGRMAQVVPDGASGAIVAWHDARVDGWGVYAQHLDSTGAATWRPEGVAISSTYGGQWNVSLAPDGEGGAIAAWQDTRASDYCDIYAQRVERSGFLGNPEPCITSVVDVPADQGGRVRVRWEPGYVDTVPGGFVDHYEVWRLVPPTPMSVPQSARRNGSAIRAASGESDGARSAAAGPTTGLWELTGTVPATGVAGYTIDAPTGRDSMLGPNPLTHYRVLARAEGSDWWQSRADSGYSVDNLPPVAPAGLTGIAAGGHVTLRWRANPDPDVAAYRLHRDNSPDFTPGVANRVCCTSDTAFADHPTRLYDYKLCAIDIHGNVGPYTTLADADIVAVGADPLAPRPVLGHPFPNPARARARVILELPSAVSVELALFDAAGRRVSSLLHEPVAAGSREVNIELRDESRKPLPGGMYWLRLSTGGESWVRRVAVVK